MRFVRVSVMETGPLQHRLFRPGRGFQRDPLLTKVSDPTPGRAPRHQGSAGHRTDLHFHDLRRQFACTPIESRADLHDVRDFLGHANITTTNQYLASSPMRLARALARLAGQGGPPADAICTPVAHQVRPSINPPKRTRISR